ncbi:hypothetical protein MP228_004958 [Amoeboaphelidium protococcarum]|nr:hypothetical protein MP228_004958 [Amoeboaphelidium protococcarum]
MAEKEQLADDIPQVQQQILQYQSAHPQLLYYQQMQYPQLQQQNAQQILLPGAMMLANNIPYAVPSGQYNQMTQASYYSPPQPPSQQIQQQAANSVSFTPYPYQAYSNQQLMQMQNCAMPSMTVSHNNNNNNNSNNGSYKSHKKYTKLQIPSKCSTCNLNFDNEASYQNHIKTHVKCDHDGCQFEASKRVVIQHKRDVHDTGAGIGTGRHKDNTVQSQKKRKIGDNCDQRNEINATGVQCGDEDDSGGIQVKIMQDAEIEQWRAERRARYPTAERVAQKAEELQQSQLLQLDKTQEYLSRFREGPLSASSMKTNVLSQDGGDQSQQKQSKKQKTKSTSNQKPCTVFAKQGKCKYGSRCRYSHTPLNSESPGADNAGSIVKSGAYSNVQLAFFMKVVNYLTSQKSLVQALNEDVILEGNVESSLTSTNSVDEDIEEGEISSDQLQQ